MPSARVPWSAGQRIAYLAFAPILAVLASLSGHRFFVWASLGLLALYSLIVGIKVIAVLVGLFSRHTVTVGRHELAALDDATLPIYTILVPLYKEAEVVPELIDGLARLDYPKQRLDIKILLEEDDLETAERLRGERLPSWIEVLTVPAGKPKTKPRACNFGLSRARGDYLVIFDAEDLPEPDQLKKALIAFRRADPSVACLQAKLNFFNRERNLLTRAFTLEYATWFDLYLPGLHALGAPIPLGGTSNHFRTAILREAGGWDAFNVTEDCDLGIRLELGGWRTEILDSTTWEEAPSALGVWLKQRSRWMKGYWQTHLVHTRRPLAMLRTLGPWKSFLMLSTVGGQVASLLVNPMCWAIGIFWLFAQWPLFDARAPWTVALVVATIALLLSNFLFVAIHMLAAWKRSFRTLLLFAPLLPFYWLLMSVGAWRGFLQFFSAPFLWEKTPHGFEKMSQAPAKRAQAAPLRHGWATGIILTSLCVTIVLAAMRAPDALHYREQIALSRIDMNGESIGAERGVDSGWVGKKVLKLACTLPKIPAVDPPIVRALVNVKVLDGEWYQVETEPLLIDRTEFTVTVAFDADWHAVGTERPWTLECLRRVRAVGVRLFGEIGELQGLELAKYEVIDDTAPDPLSCNILAAPERAAAGALMQFDFALNRAYDNPFDPERIDIWAQFTDPSGKVARVPAFYNQDYIRKLDAAKGAEILTATGAPHWSVRFAAPRAGTYGYQLCIADHRGDRFTSPRREVVVEAAKNRGYLRADPSQQYFSFEDGSFFYPIGMNIRSPIDDKNGSIGKFPVPDAAAGSYVMDDFIDKMAEARMNFGRVWMSPWYGGLEWSAKYPGFYGLGVYNLQNAWRLDHLISYAAQKGVMIEFALNSHGPYTTGYDSQWPENPYFVRNGGPAAEPREVLVGEKSRQLFKNRFRYLAARWGADPNLFAWTTWIEVNMVSPSVPDMVVWHRDLCSYLHEIDPGKHPISTEFNNEYGFGDVWAVPDIGYTQTSAYSGSMGLISTLKDCARGMAPFGKPVVLEEYGGHAQGGVSMKYLAHELHDGLWAGWMLPISAAPSPWWWNFIFAKGLQRFQHRFADFTAGEDLRQETWHYQEVAVADSSNFRAMLRVGKNTAFAWIYDPGTTDISVGRSYWEQSQQRSQLYAQRIGRFDALSEDPGDYSSRQERCSVSLRGMKLEPGRYQCEFWDTWLGKEVEKRTIDLGTDAVVPLPPFARDFAMKLKRIDRK